MEALAPAEIERLNNVLSQALDKFKEYNDSTGGGNNEFVTKAIQKIQDTSISIVKRLSALFILLDMVQGIRTSFSTAPGEPPIVAGNIVDVVSGHTIYTMDLTFEPSCSQLISQSRGKIFTLQVAPSLVSLSRLKEIYDESEFFFF